MGYNVNDRYNPTQPYVSSFVPLPLDEIAAVGAMKQKAQDAANVEKLDFLGKQVNALSPDVESVKQEKQKLDDELNTKWSNVDFNDPNVRSQWFQRKRELANQYGPQGKLGIIQANYEAAKQYEKELNDRLGKEPEKGGLDSNTVDMLKKMSMDSYQGANKGHFNGITPASNPDIDKQVIEATRDWKSNAEAKGGYWSGNGQWITKNSKELEYIDPNEVKQSVLADIMNRPENKAYANQQANISMYGEKPTESGGNLGYDNYGNQVEYGPGVKKQKIYNDIFEKPANLAAARLGFTKTKQDQEIKANEKWMEDYKDKKASDVTVISNNTQVESLTTDDFKNNLKNIKSTNSEINLLQNKLNITDPKSREYATYNQQLKELLIKKDVFESNQKTMDDALKASTHTQEPVIEGVLLNESGNKEADNLKSNFLNKLKLLPANEKTSNLTYLLTKTSSNGLALPDSDGVYRNSNEDIMKKIIAESKLTDKTKNILEDTKNIISKKVNESDDNEWRGVSGAIARLAGNDKSASNPFTLASYRINNLRNDYAEDNNKLSIGTSTLAVDPKAEKAEKSVVSGITNAYKNDLQHNSNYINFAGNSLSELISKADGVVDSKGKDTKLDITKASPLLTYKPIKGKFYLNVTFDDAFDKNGNAVTKLVAPENQNEIKAHLNTIGKELINSDSDSNREKGFEILSNVAYGSDLSIVQPQLMSNGQKQIVTLNIAGKPITVNIVKVNDHIELHDAKGKNSLYQPDGSEESDFSGVEELSKALYYTNNIKPLQKRK